MPSVPSPPAPVMYISLLSDNIAEPLFEIQARQLSFMIYI